MSESKMDKVANVKVAISTVVEKQPGGGLFEKEQEEGGSWLDETICMFQYQYYYTIVYVLILFYTVYSPNTQYVKCSMPQIPGCSTTSGPILQYASQHAFMSILTHNPLLSGGLVTSTD